MLARHERKELTMSRRKAEHGAAEVDFEEGSTNVFADIGLENADELQMRAELARHLCLAIRSMNWSVSQAARELGIERARVSELINGRLGGFSLERLGRYLTRLNRDIVIKVVKRRRRGRWQVAA